MERGKRNVCVERQRKNKDTRVKELHAQDEGIDYPLDIWFIISEYISPEVVGKFARICKSSYHVTTTGKFWFHLYKSYYNYVPGMPERLQPQCMVRQLGLRACVIRMLHYTYFRARRENNKFAIVQQEDPYSLVKRKCCLMWHKIGEKRCYFFFKLESVSKLHRTSLKDKNKNAYTRTDFMEMLEDVAVNPEEDCKILRVACQKYSMLPPVNGLTLQVVSLHLMPGFKNMRLQLGFGTSNIPNTPTNNIILAGVTDCRIFDWWHPSYPQEDAVCTIELPTMDTWD